MLSHKKDVTRNLIETLVFLLLLTVLYRAPLSNVVHLWTTSETYVHGLFIFPMAIWLIVNKWRYEINELHFSPRPAAILLILAISIGIFLFGLAQINALQQLLIIALIPAFVLFRFGLGTLLQFKAPLLFLFFAVPIGDFMIPWLQQITADIALIMLKLVNVPVYRSGLYISIPNANFLVAEACSGIRFFIATVTIGLFYTFMFIEHTSKKIIFICLSIAIPILANGFRVFMIIIIAHWGHVEAAAGFDHIVYGWLFFSIVLIALILVGRQFSTPVSTVITTHTITDHKPQAWAWMAAILATLSGPVATSLYEAQAQQASMANLQEKPAANLSQRSWAPDFYNFDRWQVTTRQNKQGTAEYHLIQYINEGPDKELINFSNKLYDPTKWSEKAQGDNVVIKQQTIPVKIIYLVDNEGKERVLFYTYQIDNEFHFSTLTVKWLQLKNKLLFKDFGGRIHIFSYSNTNQEQSEMLSQFAEILVTGVPD